MTKKIGLFDAWLASGDERTLSEFVVDRRVLARQERCQQRNAERLGALFKQMQNGPVPLIVQQGMQGIGQPFRGLCGGLIGGGLMSVLARRGEGD